MDMAKKYDMVIIKKRKYVRNYRLECKVKKYKYQVMF